MTTSATVPAYNSSTAALIPNMQTSARSINPYPANYSVFPSPIPPSPLKESPLSGAAKDCPCDYHVGNAGLVKGRGATHSSSECIARDRSAGYDNYPTSEIVYQPHYQSRMSYQPVMDQANSMAPLQGVHLYHHPDSVESMKARMALAEKGTKWNSNVINTPNNQQLAPEYMSLNPRGTIPTLVVDNHVTTDGRSICNYINSCFPGVNMVPTNDTEIDIMEYFVDLIDRQNVEALMFGKVPGVKKRTFKSPYGSRRNAIHDYENSHADNRNLVEAYKQKEAVVNYQEDVTSHPEKMRLVFGNAQDMLSQVEAQLNNGPFAFGGWLASDQFTLADIHALCFLRFLDLLGLIDCFGPHTVRYYNQGKMRPSFILAGDDWISTQKSTPATECCSKKALMGLLFGLLGASVLGAIGWGIYWFFFKQVPKTITTTTTPHMKLRHEVIRAVETTGVFAGGVSPWMKWVLLLFPVLLLVPLLLWLCGCIKCKKRHGRSRPTKAIVARSRSGSFSSRSRGRSISDRPDHSAHGRPHQVIAPVHQAHSHSRSHSSSGHHHDVTTTTTTQAIVVDGSSSSDAEAIIITEKVTKSVVEVVEVEESYSVSSSDIKLLQHGNSTFSSSLKKVAPKGSNDLIF